MNRLIYSFIISCFFLTGSGASSRTNSIFTEEPIHLSKDILNEDGLKKTYIKSNELPENENDNRNDNIPIKSISSPIKVIPSEGSYLGGCNNADYHVEISGAGFGNGWDITSVTICGVEVCQIIMQSTNLVAVYPNSGTPGTGDIVITSESKGKTTIENGFTYLVPVPIHQAKNIRYSQINATSGDISWTRGDGESCVVFMKQAKDGYSIPSNFTTYDSGIIFGDGTQIGSTGWFCVYNGNGSTVSVSGLVPGKDYIIQAFEYNGQAGFETYQISTTTDNPKIQEIIATKDRINSDSFIKNSSVSLNHTGTN